MCNDFGNRIPYSAYVEAFSHMRLPLKVPDPIHNFEPVTTSGDQNSAGPAPQRARD